MNPAQQLIEYGQSVWYDNISRELLNDGSLRRMRDEWGVRGLTSNPTIFEKAIGSSSIYDAAINKLSASDLSVDQLFTELAIEDIAEAADLLKPVYEQSKGVDGYVSIEVSPLLAADTSGTVSEAKNLFARLERPNIMIKIPGTPEGIPAVREVLEEGINVNITLLFSVENYVQVAETYCSALRARAERGLPVDNIASVASFFVSRVDTLVDGQLNELAKNNPGAEKELHALRGQLGIANSRLAYREYQRIFETDSFSDLRDKGAQVQRPLWASTSTKNPDYRDVIYVEELIGPNTVNTMPHQTLEAFVDHGTPANTITKELTQADALLDKLSGAGIDLPKVFETLQAEGVQKFSASFESLRGTLSNKLAQAA